MEEERQCESCRHFRYINRDIGRCSNEESPVHKDNITMFPEAPVCPLYEA